jgi:HNH endonuclease
VERSPRTLPALAEVHKGGCEDIDMAERLALSKKTRFEVFKRDSFTCQYCGKKAPDVLLHVDHIIAVANGGKNTITNLITSCVDCNSGKGARGLSDDSVLQKQRRQMEELNERRVQLEMMAEWRAALDDLEKNKIDMITAKIATKFLYVNSQVNDYGRQQIAKWLRKFSVDEVLTAIDISAEQYLEFEEGKVVSDSQGTAFHYIPRICGARRVQEKKPYMLDIYYIRGILRNRLTYLNEGLLISDLDYAFHVANVNPEYIKQVAKQARSWTSFRNVVNETIAEVEA